MMNILIAGQGIGKRLHEPIWRERGATVRFLHLPISQSLFSGVGRDPCDLLIIATPTLVQLAHLEHCLANWPSTLILIEKPVGQDGPELRRMIAANEGPCRRVRVNYQLRYSSVIRQLRARLATDVNASSVAFVYKSAASRHLNAASTSSYSRLRGGLFNTVVCHLIDAAVHMLSLQSVNCSVTSSVNTTTHFEGELQLAGCRTLRATFLVDTDSDTGAFTVALLNSNGARILEGDMVTGDTRVPGGDDPSGHAVSLMTSSGQGPWRNSYMAFADAFGTSSKFDETAATLNDACTVHDLLSEFRRD